MILLVGMYLIEVDFVIDNYIIIVVGSYKVFGIIGIGCGFYIYGIGKFEISGVYFD